ncbi:50S ribosomal protein L11 methyltransferase [Robiginitomaculum antarcticum]|uniref:50S ribosomal protein L11 methyltransferase n=1 Tax=Robiginitomaculum antarcticum TaxID=437507 RepID=UPI00038191CB|nr:50S ribosomal protein L11 methyltransferase [Robiginitomaculum antarcticum]
MTSDTPFALTLTTNHDHAFALSDALGFEAPMEALSVSIYDMPDGQMSVQALYNSKAEAEAALQALSLSGDIDAQVAQLPDEDWVSLSQSGLDPVEAGPFFIYGSHDAHRIPEGCAFPIQIEAGLAFGTGHHGTTKGCLLAFDRLTSLGFDPKTVLDLGTGAGVLAIAAAMKLNRTILASDIDQDSVDVTLDNAGVNNVAEHIEAIRADGFDHAALKGQKFDLIFANILAGPLLAMAGDIAGALDAKGRLILSGILVEQAGEMSDGFAAAGLICETQPSLEGWVTIIGQHA